jgi:rRNA maturation protein Nop10
MKDSDRPAGVSPFASAAKCGACGGPARLDHIVPHPTEPIDRYVYRCTRCKELTVIDRPRGSPPPSDADLQQPPPA